MGKRRNWPSAEAVAEMLAHIKVSEPRILDTHHLVGNEKDCMVVIVQEERLFGLLSDDTYINTLIGCLKAAGKPIYIKAEDIPGLKTGDVVVERDYI